MSPLIKSRWSATCATCSQKLVDTSRSWPIECDACNQRIHADTVSNGWTCSHVVKDWLIDNDVDIDPDREATVCGPCHSDIQLQLQNMAKLNIFGTNPGHGNTWDHPNLWDLFRNQGHAFDAMDSTAGMAKAAQDAYRDWLDAQPKVIRQRTSSHVFGNYHIDTTNFVKAIGRILDVVHSTGPKLPWSIKLGDPDIVPQTNLAAKIITLPNYFASQFGLGQSHEFILDTLIGTALHEAGHAAYDSAATIAKVGGAAKQHEGESAWGLQMTLNIVCDYNLERKVIERYPGFKQYFDVAVAWSVRSSLPTLVKALQKPHAEDRVDTRLMVLCWAMLCPGELTKSGAQITDKLVFIVEKCFQILKYSYGKGMLNNEPGKMATTRAIYELIRTLTPAGYQPKIGSNSQGTGQPSNQPGGQGEPSDDGNGSGESAGGGADAARQGADGDGAAGHPGSDAGRNAGGGTGAAQPATDQGADPGHDESPDGRGEAAEEPEEAVAPMPRPLANLNPDAEKTAGGGGVSGTGMPEAEAEPPQLFENPWVGESDLEDRKEGRKVISPLSEIQAPEDPEDRIDERFESSSELRYDQPDRMAEFDHRREGEQHDNSQKPLFLKPPANAPYWLPQKHRERQKTVAPTVTDLKRILRIRNADLGGKNTGRRSGVLTRRHVNRLSTLGLPNVFHQPLPDGAPSVRFALLIDESSSMHWGARMGGKIPSESARDAATALADALTGIRGVKLWVWGFSMDKATTVAVGAEFENPEDRNQGIGSTGRKTGPQNQPILRPYLTPKQKNDLTQIELPSMSGGTPTGEAMDWAAQVLLKGAKPEERKIVLVLTDGEAGGYMDTDIPIRKYWGRVDFIHIGIGGTQDPHFRYFVGPIADVAELPKALTGIAKEVLV